MKLKIFLLTAAALVLFAGAAAAVSYDGEEWDPASTTIDLGDRVVTDFDELITFLDQMPNLQHVDMWETVMTADVCDLLAGRYPNIQWGWTMKLKGKDHDHLIRTDYTSWSTLHNRNTSHHTSEDFRILKYCWDLKALDVGHNSVTSLDFLYDLPDLRVLIIALNQITDITPVASLTKLEYIELFHNKITDISALGGLTHLLDVNICFNRIADWSPLKNLVNLQRLWMYSSQSANKRPPEAVVKELRELFPNALIDDKHYSTTGQWRYLEDNVKHPHYEAITKMFGSDHTDPQHDYVPFAESYMFWDDP